MGKKRRHGHPTPDGCTAFVAGEFIEQIKAHMKERGISQADLAKTSGVSEGRISQAFKNPRHLTFRTIVKLSRGLRLKVAAVAYNHDDELPHVPAEEIRAAWEAAGRPRDFWDIQRIFGAN